MTKYVIFTFAENFLRNASLLAEVIKKKCSALLNKLEVDLIKSTDDWNEANNEFNEAIQSYLKSKEANITLYKEFAVELEQQSNIIEKSYENLKELVI